MRVFYPLAQSNRQTSVSVCYRSKELERGRAFDESQRSRKRNFCSLGLLNIRWSCTSSNSSVEKTAISHCKQKEQSYSVTISWIRCQFSFALLRSAIRCLRGYRSTRGCPGVGHTQDMDVATADSRVYLLHHLIQTLHY